MPSFENTVPSAADKVDQGVKWRKEWAEAQRLKAPGLKHSSAFYRNIEEELDKNRKQGVGIALHPPSHSIDFSTCDVLGMGHTGALREAFLEEIKTQPNFHMGAGGSRLCDGTTDYQVLLEKELAELMNVESALVVHSGWTANQAIWSTVPRSGDVLVYDELMHATALAGMKVSLALEQKPFRHNDLDHFTDMLENIKETMPLIKTGKRCVIIGVESYYSMDGDICPLKEMVDVAKSIFPLGNAQFIVDEAHSFGVMGPNGGLGFVEAEGLQDEIAVRMVTFGKALSGSGAAVLSNNTVRNLLVTQAKVFICSVAPPFTLLATARGGLRLMRTEKMQKTREYLTSLTRYYLDTITAHPTYKKANRKGILRMPVHEEGDWNDVPITHIVPMWCKDRQAQYLSFHLTRDGINGVPITFPIVPKGEDRVRLFMHAHNTKQDVDDLISSITTWAEEMMEIEASGDKNRLPEAARLAYDIVEKDRLSIV